MFFYLIHSKGSMAIPFSVTINKSKLSKFLIPSLPPGAPVPVMELFQVGGRPLSLFLTDTVCLCSLLTFLSKQLSPTTS